jgi:hypothetical protein
MFTKAGNSTTIAPMTATVTSPRPKIRIKIGAIAISGTLRSSIAMGIDLRLSVEVCLQDSLNTPLFPAY